MAEQRRKKKWGGLFWQELDTRWLIENHNSNTLVSQVDVSGKVCYGRWWAMVDVVGRWMGIDGRGGCMMESEDGGQTGHPAEFYIPKSNQVDIFLDVCMN